MKSEIKVPSYVQDAIQTVAHALSFTEKHTVQYDWTCSLGSSVVSIMYKITLTEDPKEEVTLLCKVPPPSADDTLFDLFEREVFLYGKLLPAFQKFQLDRDIPPTDEAYAFAPSCYHVHCDRKKREGIIILEDAGNNWQKFQPIDYDHARLAMMQLGRLHAVSLALKEQRPELFEQYKYMADVTQDRALELEGFESTMSTSFENAIATLNVGDGAKKEKLTRLQQTFADELKSISDTELSEPYCVVCHGDYGSNNMMFSYNGGTPNRMVMLDWQLAKYSSPALDFVHFVFLCTDESFRRNHYDNMLQTYHNALLGHLERLGTDNATEQFPLTALMRLVKLQAKQALVLAMLHIPMSVGNLTVPEVNETMEDKEDQECLRISDTTDATYQTGMAGLLKDVFRLGYL